MFDYFLKERKLHNLIWVYSAGVHLSSKNRDAIEIVPNMPSGHSAAVSYAGQL